MGLPFGVNQRTNHTRSYKKASAAGQATRDPWQRQLPRFREFVDFSVEGEDVEFTLGIFGKRGNVAGRI